MAVCLNHKLLNMHGMKDVTVDWTLPQRKLCILTLFFAHVGIYLSRVWAAVHCQRSNFTMESVKNRPGVASQSDFHSIIQSDIMLKSAVSIL